MSRRTLGRLLAVVCLWFLAPPFDEKGAIVVVSHAVFAVAALALAVLVSRRVAASTG